MPRSGLRLLRQLAAALPIASASLLVGCQVGGGTLPGSALPPDIEQARFAVAPQSIPDSAGETPIALLAVGDGDLILVSNAAAVDPGLELRRIGPDGLLDGGYRGRFEVDRSLASDTLEARDALLDAAGRLIVTGHAALPGGGRSFAFLRFGPDGALDASFAEGGYLSLDLGQGLQEAESLALAQDGGVFGAGWSLAADGAVDVALVKLDAAGALDPTFGIAGVAKLRSPQLMTFQRAVDVQQPDPQRIRVAVDLREGVTRTSQVALLDLFSDGTPDRTQGLRGWIQPLPADGQNSRATQMLGGIEPELALLGSSDGRAWILGAGASGQVDPNFGDRGVARASPLLVAEPKSSLRLPDGRIWSLLQTQGDPESGAASLLLWSLLNSGRPDPDLGTVGLLRIAERSEPAAVVSALEPATGQAWIVYRAVDQEGPGSLVLMAIDSRPAP